VSAEPPADDREQHETKRQSRGARFLKSPAGKVAAGIGAAFIAALGAWLFGVFKGTAERTFAGSPISVRVMTSGETPAGHPYAPYFVVPAGRIPSPRGLSKADVATLADDRSWGLEHGGVAGSPQIVRVELRGKSDDPLIVDPIRVDVVNASDPVSGWFVASPACGGLLVRTIEINLDATPPSVTYLDEHGQPTDPLTLRVDRQDPEVLELQAYTARAQVEWTAELPYSTPDGAGSVELDNGGDPFRVTTETASKGYEMHFNTTKTGARGAPVLGREPTWDNGIDAC
jgi:hypothetical protein